MNPSQNILSENHRKLTGTLERMKVQGKVPLRDALIAEIAGLAKSTGIRADQSPHGDSADLMALCWLEAERDRLKAHAKPAPKAAAPKPAAKVSGADILEAAVNPKFNASAVAGLQQSLAARLGIEEAGPTCTREEFQSLNPRQKMQFSKKGGRISEPRQEAAPVPVLSPGAKIATRAQFAKLNPRQKMDFIVKNKGTLVD